MNIPFLSIIIPIYQVEEYLNQCLESIVFMNGELYVELILIDDGSQDNSGKIADGYKAKYKNDFLRIEVIHQNNHGVADSRNKGLNVALGEWIWFVDSDDIVYTCNLNMELLGEKIKDCDLLTFDYATFGDGGDGILYKKNNYAINKKQKNLFLCENINYHHQALWYKRALIEKYHLKFTTGLKMAEDLEFMYKYMMVCQHPFRLDACMYYYRNRRCSLSHSVDTYRNQVNGSIIVLYNWLEFIKNNHIIIERWLEIRMKKFVKTLLYAASKLHDINVLNLQNEINGLIDGYADCGFTFMKCLTLKIAYCNTKLYFLINKIYLTLKLQEK